MSDWQPIETAPSMRNIILFAESQPVAGTRNWRMETGYFHTGTGWNWGGRFVASWDISPTHWLPLPEPPPEARAKGAAT